MGMFDSVNFYCPVCSNKINIQSKADGCTLTEYDRIKVPRRIAADIDGEKVICNNCKSELEISSHIGRCVPMYLTLLTIGELT